MEQLGAAWPQDRVTALEEEKVRDPLEGPCRSFTCHSIASNTRGRVLLVIVGISGLASEGPAPPRPWPAELFSARQKCHVN